MTVTVFGEVLCDIFGNEIKMGGAPYNFAAHVTKLGGNANFISAIGKDELGDGIIKEAEKIDLDTKYIQAVDKPTGRCIVTLDKSGTPTYEIVKDTAMDNIPMPGKETLVADAFYFGTLAQRGEVSYSTLSKMLEGTYKEVFFDINIRQNYYSDEIIDASLKKTTIFKISREEIGVLGIDGTPEEICREVAKRYPNLKLIIITLDKDGSVVFECATGKLFNSPKPQSKVVSTVGAGDSFSAGFVYNFLNGESIETCITRATLLSDYVVTQLEAVPDYPDELISKIK